MKAASAAEPPTGDDWTFELKYDGMRAITFVTPTGVRVQSANERDVTASFPELASMAVLADGVDMLILDGELIAFDNGRLSFGAMQHRMHVTDAGEAARRARANPVMYVVFDLLGLHNHDTTALPLDQRRQLLHDLVEPGPNWKLATPESDPDPLLDAVNLLGLEGIVAKRTSSTYQPGRRSSDWRKIKPQGRQEFVVGGWTTGLGQRTGSIGSLLLGYHDPSGLRYAGRAGSGLSQATISEWDELVVRRATSPFVDEVDLPRDRQVLWCEPNHVVEIAYGEWPDGGHLRHPVVLGRRTDKAAPDVQKPR